MESLTKASFGVSGVVVALSVVLLSVPGRAERILSVAVEGTQFKVTLDSGQVLDSLALSGAVLNVDMPGANGQLIRIESVQRDSGDPAGDVFLHHMLAVDVSGRWQEFCQPYATGANWAFPLKGQWDSEGQHTSENGFTLTCASGALGKCVRFGYKPWKTGRGGIGLANYHAACVKAVRADYCGNRGTTRDGQSIDIYDALAIQKRDATPSTEAMPFEAAFSPLGAVCVAHTRCQIT